jgi:uncharacterized protein with HEPN domain
MKRGGALRLRQYLEHIAQAIARIEAYTAGMDLPAYLSDPRTQDAVVRNMEVIGEASNNIRKHHSAFAEPHSDTWRLAYEMRNALSHAYFKVDQEIVWRTIQSDLPPLAAFVDSALATLVAQGK